MSLLIVITLGNKRLEAMRDGLPVKYYHSNQTQNTDAYALLGDAQGDGQCHAITDLFMRSTRHCGVDVKRYMILPATGLEYILIKNWDFKAGSVPAKHSPFTHRMDQADHEVEMATGLPGQGHADPKKKRFTKHFVIQYGNSCYDPSYGSGPFPLDRISDWEEIALEGVTKLDTVRNKENTEDRPNTEIARKRANGDPPFTSWNLAQPP